MVISNRALIGSANPGQIEGGFEVLGRGHLSATSQIGMNEPEMSGKPLSQLKAVTQPFSHRPPEILIKRSRSCHLIIPTISGTYHCPWSPRGVTRSDRGERTSVILGITAAQGPSGRTRLAHEIRGSLDQGSRTLFTHREVQYGLWVFG